MVNLLDFIIIFLCVKLIKNKRRLEKKKIILPRPQGNRLYQIPLQDYQNTL